MQAYPNGVFTTLFTASCPSIHNPALVWPSPSGGMAFSRNFSRSSISIGSAECPRPLHKLAQFPYHNGLNIPVGIEVHVLHAHLLQHLSTLLSELILHNLILLAMRQEERRVLVRPVLGCIVLDPVTEKQVT